jgi:two-component system, NtrC family, sensor kinase
LSRKEAKSRTQDRKLRSTGTKARARVGRMREPRADLEQQLEKYKRDLAEARQHLAEALEHQAATSEILRVISSSPTEVQPVLNAVGEHAARLCDANNAVIFRLESDLLRHVASYGGIPTTSHPSEGLPVNRDTVSGRAVCDHRTIHVHDLAVEDIEYPVGSKHAKRDGHRTTLATPLLREGVPVGAILIRRMEVRPFSEKQIALLETFANQAAIAIENARLFEAEQQRTRELSEALEQQTATAEILSVISNSLNDTQPVFDAIVHSGQKLLGGATMLLTLAEDDVINAAAIAAPDAARVDAIRDRWPVPLSREYMHGVAILDRRFVDIPDAENVPINLATGAATFLKTGYRAITIMPMIRGDAAIGALGVMRVAPGPLSDKQLALLRTFANQAVIAIENTRLLNELRESLQQQTATADVLKVISRSTFDLQSVLETLTESAAGLCDAYDALILLREDESLVFGAAQQDSPAFARILRGVDPHGITGREALAGLPILRKSELPELQRLNPPVVPENSIR